MILFRPSRMKMAIPSICAYTDSPLVGVRADALYSAGFRPKVWPAAVCAGLYFVSGTLHWIRELSLSLPECKTSSLTTRSDYFRTGRPRYMLTLTISMYSKYSFVTSGTMIFMLLHSNCSRLRIPYYIQSRRQRLLPPVVSATEHRTSSHIYDVVRLLTMYCSSFYFLYVLSCLSLVFSLKRVFSHAPSSPWTTSSSRSWPTA